MQVDYWPIEVGIEEASKATPSECLVLGQLPDPPDERLAGLAQSVRHALVPTGFDALLAGVYLLRTGSRVKALVIFGREAGEAASGNVRRLPNESHLVEATFAWQHAWDEATSLRLQDVHSTGDLVEVVSSGRLGRVESLRAGVGGYEYEVVVDGRRRRYRAEDLKPTLGDPSDPRFWLTQEPADAAATSLMLTWTKLTHPLSDTLYSYAASKVLFRPYQFKPVLKVLSGSTGRLLIADEVGLGKTIEAGLVWSELEYRAELKRILVVVPAALRFKWKTEMERRFDRKLDLLRPQDLLEFARRLERDGDAEIAGIVSLQSLRTAQDALEKMQELQPRFDLVIVDEAHDLRNPGTRSHIVGRSLADWADYLLFLSATPLNLRSHDLFTLVNMLDEETFSDPRVFGLQLEPNSVLNQVAKGLVEDRTAPPNRLVPTLEQVADMELGWYVADRPEFKQLRELLDSDAPLDAQDAVQARRHLVELNTLAGVLSRTRKRDVPDARAVREPITVDVEWTEEERRFYEAVYAWYMQKALRAGTPPGFAMQMPLRQAASCIPAMQQRLLDQGVTGLMPEVDDREDVDDDSNAGLDDLDHIAALRRPLGRDTKFEQFFSWLTQARQQGVEQFMVFAFFRGTLAYLQQRLSPHFKVAVMHGGVPLLEREQIMEDFRRGEYQGLLLSEVGSEGLDFEFCNLLVNYDLPWNPMRVEQRIGRLDRFGQQHEKIFILNFRVPGTIESDIFQRLYDRIHLFESSIGELEPILRDGFEDIAKTVLDPRLSLEQRQAEADRKTDALLARAQQIDDIKAADGLLAGIDGLLIEGMDERGPGRGRFIGTTEVQRMLRELTSRYPARIASWAPTGTTTLRGSPSLAQALRGFRVDGRGSRYSPAKLQSMLRDEEDIHVTFDPETASRHDVELLSVRHPLLRLAIRVLAEDDLEIKRFGRIAVPGLPGDKHYLVSADIAEYEGLRQKVELWLTAIDLSDGSLAPPVSEVVMTALAEGRINDSAVPVPDNLAALAEALHGSVSEKWDTRSAAWKADNVALIDGRIAALNRSTELQLEKAKETLARVRQEGRDPRIIRLNEGRVRNLHLHREQKAVDLERKRTAAVSLVPMAYLLVEGTDQ